MGICTVLKEFSCKQKSSIQNCEALQNEEFFPKTRYKIHGKADACRGFLVQYWGKSTALERTNP